MEAGVEKFAIFECSLGKREFLQQWDAPTPRTHSKKYSNSRKA